MRNITNRIIIFFILLFSITGCSDDEKITSEISNPKKVDVLFVGSKKNTSGFQKATENAKAHYDLVRAALKAEEAKDYDEAIALLNEALLSAEFRYEKSVVYMSLAEIYAAKNDLESEMKYRLLDAEFSGNENSREQSLHRVDEIRSRLLATQNASEN